MTDLEQLLKTRRTHRRFQQIPISDEDAAYIVRAQQYASCSRNEQHLRYLVIRSPELLKAIFPHTHWAGRLPRELGFPKPEERPTMYILVMDLSGGKNYRAELNAGLAISNMTLAAWERGIGSCILGNIARAQIQKVLNIPSENSLLYLLAMGYPADSSRVLEISLGGDCAYFMEAPNQFVVPKYRVEDICEYR